MKKMLKRKLTSLVVLVLILQASLLTPFFALKTEVRAQDEVATESFVVTEELAGDSYLAFTSDAHNQADNASADRLWQWLEIVQGMYGSIDYMGFCGDMADASGGTHYWDYTQAVMDVVSKQGIAACYTTGNHEFSHGDSSSSYQQELNDTTRLFTVNAAPFNLPEGANYSIYALGSMSSSQTYTEEQIDLLQSYLAGEADDKPIIVLAHYPLHYATNSYGYRRTTGNADRVINVLNAAADSGKEIIFLWGHNHTLADSSNEPNYDQIFIPGESIRYDSSSQQSIHFYYAAAGCMSDYPYSTGSEAVLGKGLVIQVRTDGGIGFAYYDAEGNDVTEEGDYPRIEIHDEIVWSEPTWSWSDDLTSATATFIGSNSGVMFEETVEAEITQDETAVGLIPYTATVEFNGEIYKDTKCVDLTVNISLELKDGIILHIYVKDLPDGTDPSDYIIYYNDVYGNPLKAVLTDLTENQLSVDVDSPEMSQMVNIEIRYKDATIYSNYASVQKYCDKVIDNEESEDDLVELCYAILHYGTSAQQLFSKHLDALANANHPELPYELEDVPETLTKKTLDDTKISKATMSLNLQYQTEMFFYFTPANGLSAEDISAEVWKDGVIVEDEDLECSVKADGRLQVKVKHIKAIDLADIITVTLSADGKQIGEVSASPNAYLYLARNVSELADLSSAMYNYYVKTVKYFEK